MMIFIYLLCVVLNINKYMMSLIQVVYVILKLKCIHRIQTVMKRSISNTTIKLLYINRV